MTKVSLVYTRDEYIALLSVVNEMITPAAIKQLTIDTGFRTGIGYASWSSFIKGVGNVWRKIVKGLNTVGLGPG